MIDVHCKGCHRLLAKAESMNAAIKCPKCKMIFEYKIFSNLFVTDMYDPTVKGLHLEKVNDKMPSESQEDHAG